MAKDHRNALPTGFEFEGYRIAGVLGAGGFGITYLADEIDIGRRVAIKEYMPASIAVRDKEGFTVHPASSSDEKDFEYGLARFRDEARTLVNFRHPNIVSVFRFFQFNGSAYLVMEYVEGESLDEFLARQNGLPEADIREILIPILDGLEAVHGAGFLHRDIKPANIYIRKDGSPILIDFGSARLALGEKSKSLTAIVSSHYAPFEQYSSRVKQGPWTDLYALGATLYRAMTGAPPPEATDRIVDDDMTPALEAGRGRYSEGLLDAVDSVLAVNGSDRPQTVAEFRSLVAETEGTPATGRQTEAAPAGPAGKTIFPQEPPAAPAGPAGTTIFPQEPSAAPMGDKKKNRSPALLWVIAALAAVILVGGGYWGWTAYQESEQRRITAEEARRKVEAAIRKREEEARRIAETKGRIKGLLVAFGAAANVSVSYTGIEAGEAKNTFVVKKLVIVETSAKIKQPRKLTIAEVHVRDVDWNHFPPHKASLVMKGLTINSETLDKESARFLQYAGLKRIIAELAYSHTFDQARKTVVSDISFDGGDLGRVKLSTIVGNVDRMAVEYTKAENQRHSLVGASIEIWTRAAAKYSLATIAKMEKITFGQAKINSLRELRQLLRAENDGLRRQLLSIGLRAIEKPVHVTLSARPASPLLFGNMHKYAINDDLKRKLSLTIMLEDAP